MTGVTVRGIAERIRRPGEDLTKVVDRVRNWTDEDLLTVTGEKNPGTGRRRLYSKDALIEALVLSVLTDAVGMQAVVGRSFAKLFMVARHSLKRDIDSAKVGPGQRFLIVSKSRDGGNPSIGTSWSKGLPSYFQDDAAGYEAHIVIDLWNLHQRLTAMEQD